MTCKTNAKMKQKRKERKRIGLGNKFALQDKME